MEIGVSARGLSEANTLFLLIKNYIVPVQLSKIMNNKLKTAQVLSYPVKKLAPSTAPLSSVAPSIML